MARRITCINKSAGYHQNPYEAISHLGWTDDITLFRGKSTREDMYDFIVSPAGVAYVMDNLGNKAYLIASISDRGTKFLKTKADDIRSDNLLTLPECS